ncbi:MAG: type IV pilus secretin PilQ [Methylacidiphilales bacterium]|nr:type IV pilus secretin PilQ [Candidatus Methylacidiphilales bacterium]
MKKLLLLLTLVVSGTSVGAQSTITSAVATDDSSESISILFTFKDGKSIKPRIIALSQPLSLNIDFDGVSSEIATATLSTPKMSSKGIKDIRSYQDGKKTRFIVTLTLPVSYEEVSSGDNQYIIKINTATSKITKLKNIDFKRLPNRGGSVIIETSGGTALLNPRTEGKSLVIDINNSSPNSEIVQNYDVSDFESTLKSFSLYPINNQNITRVTVQTDSDDYDYVTYQRESLIIIEVKPLTQDQISIRQKNQPQYKGEKISLSFNNIEVRTALNIIADVSKLDMIISDSVGGQLTLNLKDIPWDEALDVILKSKNLSKRIDGNILRIGTVEEFSRQDKLELESTTVAKAVAPLRSEFIQINYAKASEIASLLKGDAKNTFISERGSVIIDARTNTLLIKETAENLNEIRNFIGRLDIPIKQVLIESRIVIANNTFSDEIGSRFGFTGNYTKGDNTLQISPTAALSQSNLDTLATPGNTKFPIGGGFNYSNAISGGGIIGATLGSVKNGFLTLELSAMQVEDRGEVVSNPRVITVEQKEATIEQGVDIPYQESGANGATTTSFKKATLGLTVTPQITPDEKVIMDLKIKKDSPGTAGANGVPSIDTRQVTTQVIVSNGDTIVLGGIFEQSKRSQRSKVPLFGDIPILGALFRRDTQSDSKTELLIFITPKIIKATVR